MSSQTGKSPEEALRASLLLRVADGDHGAMQDLFVHMRDPLFRLFHRLSRCEAEAEDLLQNTFLSLWRYRKNFAGKGRASSYLFRIAINQWRRSCSRERRAREVHQRFAREADPRSSTTEPVPPVETAELRKRVWSAIDALPLPQKETFLLHRFHDLSCREIAEATGEGLKTVESRLRLALSKLTDRLRLQEGLR